MFGRRVSPDDGHEAADRFCAAGSPSSPVSVIDNIRYFAGLYEQNNAKRDEMVREALRFVGLEIWEVCRQKVVGRRSVASTSLAALPTAPSSLCLMSRPLPLTHRAAISFSKASGDEPERFNSPLRRTILMTQSCAIVS